MALSIDSRLWLATHLLYPNSSQAFDVYQSLISQSEDLIKKSNRQVVFKKLFQIVLKIPAVNSNKAFHVFEDKQTDQWQQIYKKSQKEQLIIFIGYFIFGMTVQEISQLLRISYEKAIYSFQQTFKKSVLLNLKTEVPDKIKFKKKNEQKVSFLYTNENLIDFCLKTLPKNEMEKVELGLSLYPELQQSKKQYDLIVHQMYQLVEEQDLLVSKPLIQISEPLSSFKESPSLQDLFMTNKRLVASVIFSFVFISLAIIRPSWLQKLSLSTKERFVVLQEVQPRPYVVENDEGKFIYNQVNNNFLFEKVTQNFKEPLLSQILDPTSVHNQIIPFQYKIASSKLVKNTNVPSVQLDQLQTQINDQPTVSGNESKDSQAQKIALNSTNEKKITDPSFLPKERHEVEHVNPKNSGGLYRGTLIVSDLNEVTPLIKEKIVSVGAKKAGEVELGWKKSEKLSYYHFTLPETNITEVQDFLKKFGQFHIQYENHPRLMPAGVKRLIIEVKERD